MTVSSNARLVVFSALLALLSFVVMTGSAIVRGELAAVAAMSVGQGLAVMSLAIYGWALFRDMKNAKVLGGENDTETRGS